MARNSRNTRNPRSELFKSLTSYFLDQSLIVEAKQAVASVAISLTGLPPGLFQRGQEFKKSNYNSLGNMQPSLVSGHNRTERYVDFDQMEYTPEIASALDIYADEMTTHSALQPMLGIKCSNEEIKALLHSLYHDVLNIEFNLFGWCRSMCKYGDFFLYLDVDDNAGIRSSIGLPIQEVERLEGEDPTNADYVQFQWNTAGLTLENWQMAHCRILGNDKHAPYGTSVLESSRRIWRQLSLLEDAMMAYRIVRSPERRVYYVDVGAIPPNEVEQYMQKVMTQMKRNSIVDEGTGRVDLRYNPLSVEEDIYIPQRGGTSSRVETLPGGQFTGDIDDVKYLRDKLFAALKIPASYLSRGEGSDEDKTTLAQKDIRFARTIQRLQRSVVSELEKIGIVHLYTLGFRGDDLINFKLHLNNPSKIAELQELEHWDKKFAVAGAATEGFFSRRWISEHLFSMSDEVFLRNQRELFYDRKFDAQLAAVAEAEAEESAGLAWLGGDAGGDLGGDLAGVLATGDALGDALGVDTGEPPPETPADEPEDVLLATPPPGRREDEPTPKSLEPQANGKEYRPVKDNRDRRQAGAYKRHIAADGSNCGRDKDIFSPA